MPIFGVILDSYHTMKNSPVYPDHTVHVPPDSHCRNSHSIKPTEVLFKCKHTAEETNKCSQKCLNINAKYNKQKQNKKGIQLFYVQIKGEEEGTEERRRS